MITILATLLINTLTLLAFYELSERRRFRLTRLQREASDRAEQQCQKLTTLTKELLANVEGLSCKIAYLEGLSKGNQDYVNSRLNSIASHLELEARIADEESKLSKYDFIG